MQVLIKQGFMAGRLDKRESAGLLSVILAVLVLGQNLKANEKQPADANKPPEIRSDFPIEDASDPNQLLRSKWDAVALVLQKNDINEQTKADEIDRIITPAFDFTLMAKLALGEKQWSKLNQRQCEDFTRLFVDKLRSMYREKISAYNNDVATLKPPVESRKGTTWIPMEIVSQERNVGLLYKLRKADDRWKIYDVEIEGVSVLLTYRAQFEDILSKGTIEDLLTRLAEKQPAQ